MSSPHVSRSGKRRHSAAHDIIRRHGSALCAQVREAIRQAVPRRRREQPMETLEQRIQRAMPEEVAIVAYDPAWPETFRQEKQLLLSCLPPNLIRRVEHFGSTAVPGLAAKPIIDILVEVTDLEATKVQIALILEAKGYDYFWRPTHGDDGPPFYAWFIKRDQSGARTHHIPCGRGPLL